MAWKHDIMQLSADVLRFVSRGAMLIAVIALSLAGTYVIVKLAFFAARFLDRTLFAEPW